MITILVPTDFSTNAHWATDYALELARQLSARLVLTHFHDPISDSTSSQMGLTVSSKATYYSVMQQLYRVRSQLLIATDGAVTITVLSQFNTVNSPSTDTVVNQKVDLLVVGLENLSLQQRTQFSLLAHQPMPFTQAPVLLVPTGQIYQKPETIVLVLTEPLHAHALGTILWFTRLFKVPLDVIRLEVAPDVSFLKKASHPIRNYLGNQLHTIRCMSAQDLVKTLENYIEQPNGEWMILLPGLYKRLLPFLTDSTLHEMAP